MSHICKMPERSGAELPPGAVIRAPCGQHWEWAHEGGDCWTRRVDGSELPIPQVAL